MGGDFFTFEPGHCVNNARHLNHYAIALPICTCSVMRDLYSTGLTNFKLNLFVITGTGFKLPQTRTLVANRHIKLPNPNLKAHIDTISAKCNSSETEIILNWIALQLHCILAYCMARIDYHELTLEMKK
ncbi:hypothetical protein HELRODRAFT_166006 [Helobdella robusta]|uniref:Uncharacterized protein n=1 Tax=Helobdella robusta TaxID=6412 RepID=T1EXK8_HELRO|nr:hypothetical protein HELRODRAFT_166006 [Helobdella robusta]ESN90348.1 hypothetical protein HELRODRAFT_166006 [Helobdella robusta]